MALKGECNWNHGVKFLQAIYHGLLFISHYVISSSSQHHQEGNISDLLNFFYLILYKNKRDI